MCGTVGIGAAAAVIALAGGADVALALGLWTVVAARSAAAVPYVRTQLLRARRGTSPRWPSDVAQGLAVLAVAAAWGVGALPLAPVLAIAVVAIVNVVAVRVAPCRAVVIGVQQMLIGAAVVAVTAIAVG